MPSILIIADHRLNRSPSQRYRFEQYLAFFNENGFSWTLSEIITEKDDLVFYGPGHYPKKAFVLLKSLLIRFKDLRRLKQFDLIFIQREALLIGSSFFEKQFYKRNKVIFDFDDSIWLLDTSPENKKFEFLKNPNKTNINIRHAHAVIAGNTYLANYAKQYHKQVFVIPTTIDTSTYVPKSELRNPDTVLLPGINQQQQKIVIGWSGSISTIKHFELAIPALKIIEARYPHQLEIHVIGQGTYQHSDLNIISKRWTPYTEVDHLNAFDIGIMPLPNDEWVKGKCGLKGLSYMACGVATIMSPVGVNTEIIQHGHNGFLASTEEEWIHCLSLLIENKELRKTLGDHGRNTVVQHYSVEANKQKYLAVFNSLIK